MTNTPPPELDEEAAAAHIGMSAAFLKKERLAGRGPAHYKLGAAIRYSRQDLDVWLSSRRSVPSDLALLNTKRNRA